MFNLAQPRPQREARLRRMAAVEFTLAITAIIAALYLWYPRMQTQPPAPQQQVAPRQLPVHPVYRHIQLWQGLSTSLPTEIKLTALDFGTDRWRIHLESEQPEQLTTWQSKLVDITDIEIKIQHSQPHEGSYRFTYEAWLP